MAENTYLSGQPIICQLLSYLPEELADQSVSEHQSNRKMPMIGFTPDPGHITAAACTDKTFPGQPEVQQGAIYIFDKGYVYYPAWEQWTDNGVFYVIRLNENASYQI